MAPWGQQSHEPQHSQFRNRMSLKEEEWLQNKSYKTGPAPWRENWKLIWLICGEWTWKWMSGDHKQLPIHFPNDQLID